MWWQNKRLIELTCHCCQHTSLKVWVILGSPHTDSEHFFSWVLGLVWRFVLAGWACAFRQQCDFHNNQPDLKSYREDALNNSFLSSRLLVLYVRKRKIMCAVTDKEVFSNKITAWNKPCLQSIFEPQNRVVRDVCDWHLCPAMVCVHTQQTGQLRIYLNPVF